MPDDASSHPLAAHSLQHSMGATPKFIGAVKDEWQLYSDRAEDYTIGEPIGFGASSIVYQALWKPADDPNAKPTPCALKVLDLDSLPPRSLQLLQRETTLMSLSKHPNVLRVRGSWMDGHRLYIALRLMSKGSVADVMRYGWPGGMDEEVVKCILRQTLKGLNYLHINGFIHRDIKAANLLIDDDGTVLLGDLGVAADLAEDPHHHVSSNKSKVHAIPASVALSPHHSAITTGSRPKEATSPTRPGIGKRKSFVGTPCWMAPELIQGKQYDASADIWSFGITALELAQGHPPRFRESTQRVLLRTLREEPPTLDRDGGTFKFTRAFKEMIDSCLHKDPSKRPTAEQLLQSPFFRSAKKKSFLVNAILKDLPPLTKRQERRALPTVASPNSIDSWDFPTSLMTPTTSVLRYSALEELVAAEDRELALQNQVHDAVFEFDNELTPSTQRFSVDQLPKVDEVHESDSSSHHLSTSPGTIARSLTSTSGTASTNEVSTAPSSYVAAPSIHSYKKDSSRPSTGYSSSNHSNYDFDSASNPADATILPTHKTAPNLSQLSSSHHKKLSSAASDSDLRGLDGVKASKSVWKKFKDNLKRPGTSSSGYSAAGEESPVSRSLDKASVLSGLFTSVSKSSVTNGGRPSTATSGKY
ncbi:STE/STE20/FRAY protein kinase [Coprinopsis cinerea okayama7|uniref:STE/STE20/FRAY protein kinase n=1 Tax=Coprinopsis cinerea (strain Okayama-7 / 130 / ATCC MYA-4618 / FGSC 9003) TaxID=240176 RepID=A8N0G0_COPC7|nr:STE/STE20/FRAY protein kinase [Coprinopsis cinerea okayama7\|eukprot:XP_001828410.1 STE/STE20/FRAY protein kinase [Coprinopsis cinerea okayama7\